MNDQNNPKIKRSVKGTKWVVITAVILAALVLLNVGVGLLPRAWTNFVADSSDAFSISAKSKSFFKSLDKDVTIYYVYDPEETYDFEYAAKFRVMLDKYARLCDSVELVYMDVSDTEFISQYYAGTLIGSSLIIEGEERFDVITYDELFMYAFPEDKALLSYGEFITVMNAWMGVAENYAQTYGQEAAVAYAEQRLSAGLFVSLGGFGGYLVVGFDHSVKNVSGYDFAVSGNAFDGSSEPAVIWVMQDENCDGMPNDVWYELRGSESGNDSTIQNYSVTYYRPTVAGEPVPWSDSLGGSGEVDYLAAYHSQEYYYPLWIAEDSYTLCGTRLEARNYDSSGNGSLWIQPSYGWGYADNFSSEDFVSTDRSNRFDISNAVTDTGKSVGL